MVHWRQLEQSFFVLASEYLKLFYLKILWETNGSFLFVGALFFTSVCLCVCVCVCESASVCLCECVDVWHGLIKRMFLNPDRV